ncbi:MAG: hypothetical protein HKL96_09100 [Phycisphaerales bacterium]|nr:hypothetical protein [Phycisphaerales bacterium]
MTTPTPTIANPGAFFIVDAAVAAQQAAVIRTAMTAITRHGGTLLVLNMQSRNISSVNKMLPEPVALTNRRAASLVKGWPSNVTAPLSLASLYFAQDKNPWIIAHGLTGPFVAHAQVLLHACPTNWLAWTRKPEFLKPATVYESQRQTKTAGAALVRSDLGKGRLFLATLRLSLNDPRKRSLLRALLVNLRVADHARRNEATRLHAPSDGPRPLK